MKYLLSILLPLALYAQPQSPNFIMTSETFSALTSLDSAQDYRLRSMIGQLSVVNSYSTNDYVFTSGFLSPVIPIPLPQIALDPDTLQYGELWTNTPATDSFRVLNSGNADLRVDSIHSDNSVFPSLLEPFLVLPGQSHVLNYAIQIPETLDYSANLTAFSSAGTATILLLAQGIWTELVSDVESLDFGVVAVGDSSDHEITLHSSGNTGLTITSLEFSEDYFIIAEQPDGEIGAHESTNMTVRFRAIASGVFLDTLSISNTAGEPLEILLTAGATAASNPAEIPTNFSLDQNYPNPFNPSTSFHFGLPRAAHLTIEIYDILGRSVTRLMDGELTAGYHVATWSCSDCPTGLYIARMTSPDVTITRKLLLLK